MMNNGEKRGATFRFTLPLMMNQVQSNNEQKGSSSKIR
jgi:hypothetical protein